MNYRITRDIITDLLPVYLSGEASADTRALVDSYLKENPDFARVVEQESHASAASQPSSAKPDQELLALRMAKRRLRRRTWLLVGAVFFTFTTFAFSIEPTGITWTWEVSPLLTLALALGAAAFWYGYSRINRAGRLLGI